MLAFLLGPPDGALGIFLEFLLLRQESFTAAENGAGDGNLRLILVVAHLEHAFSHHYQLERSTYKGLN